MSARTELAAALTAALPTYRVLGYAADLDAVARPTVLVWADKIVRRPEWASGLFEFTLMMWVLVGTEDPARADDALDDALEDVLGALQPIGWVQWSGAERGVLRDAFHGWQITVTAVATIGD